jgi:hypothetical protein
MTTQRGHRQPPTDGRSSPASRLSRSATRSTGPTAQPPPHDDDQVEADPAAGPARPFPASRARLQPGADDAPSWTRRATTPTRAIPAVRLPAPPPRPMTSFPSDTTDAGGRTLDTWTLRRPHRTPGTGQERGHGDDSTAGVRTSLAATPSDRTLRRPTVFALSHYQPAPRAKRRPGALLSSDDFGSRVELEALGQVLWRVRMKVAGGGGSSGPAAAEAWRRRLVDGGRLLLADPSSGLEVKVIQAILIRLLPGTRSVL